MSNPHLRENPDHPVEEECCAERPKRNRSVIFTMWICRSLGTLHPVTKSRQRRRQSPVPASGRLPRRLTDFCPSARCRCQLSERGNRLDEMCARDPNREELGDSLGVRASELAAASNAGSAATLPFRIFARHLRVRHYDCHLPLPESALLRESLRRRVLRGADRPRPQAGAFGRTQERLVFAALRTANPLIGIRWSPI